MAGERGASDAPTTAAASSFDDDGCQDFVTWCLHVGETGYLPLGAVWTEGNCTVTFTLNWGDGSPPETRTLTNSADIASHVYTNVGLYTATAASQIVAGCWPTTDYGATSIIQVIDLTADAGGPYTVVRAETVTLDASASVGPDPITSYRWDFTPGANCPSGTTLRHKTVTKTDPTADIVVLCDLLVTLTVTDTAGQTKQDPTTISVQRREGTFKPTKVKLDTDKPDDPRTPHQPLVATNDPSGRVGRNVSQCRKDTAPLVLCPPSDGKDETGQKDEKAKKAFDIATVDNPKGPFNGFEYVSRNRVYIHQIALLNSNLFSGSPHRWADPEHPGQTITWRDFNLRKGINVARLIDAISQHEGWGRGGSAKDPKASGHAGATQLALRAKPQKNDPAIILEQMFDRSEAKLEDKARTKLMNADIALITAAQDPLPPIGSGALWLWAPSMHRWLHCNVTVGGEDLDADCGDD